jgi:hypothetical protein
MEKYVWEFTNQRKLTKKEFIHYFEKKLYKTIRKYQLLPENKTFLIKEDERINTIILKQILSKKFKVINSNKPNTSTDNLSDIAEKTFENILQGNFIGPKPKEKNLIYPLYFHSDKEIEVYSKINNIIGKKSKRNKQVQDLFNKFIKKNPDLEINVIKALMQISN